MALRTVPVILKYGKKKILVNCFLDEGSNTTYVNEGVVEELGVKGEKELITVNVANDQQVSFPSMSFTIGVESVDWCVDAKIVAQRATGNHSQSLRTGARSTCCSELITII